MLKSFNCYCIFSDLPSTELGLAKRASQILCSTVISSMAKNVAELFPNVPDIGLELFNFEQQEWSDELTQQILVSKAATASQSLSIAMLAKITNQDLSVERETRKKRTKVAKVM